MNNNLVPKNYFLYSCIDYHKFDDVVYILSLAGFKYEYVELGRIKSGCYEAIFFMEQNEEVDKIIDERRGI